ncbi:MAG: ABC transporter ATP-binding protein [Elusimicrobia bacterium]|nr:ABC transporter ATP-binding protein [Elusimicrobiota bacterium]
MILEVRDIAKRFLPSGGASLPVTALDGVGLSVSRCERVGIVGESGCGKTTLARIIMGLVRADRGEVLWKGQRVWDDPVRQRDLRRKVRMVFQDPFASLDPRFTVRRTLEEALCLEGNLPRDFREDKMREALSSVGLSQDSLGRYPHEFSGGERQRVSLARALMTDPELLILDEVVSALDVLVARDILDLLERISADKGIALLFISHNIRAVARISSKIAVMDRGKIVECGSAASVLASPRSAEARTLLSAALHYRVPEK